MIIKIIKDYLKFLDDAYLHSLGLLRHKDFEKKEFFSESWTDSHSLVEFKIYKYQNKLKAVKIRQCVSDGKLDYHEVDEKTFSDNRFGYALACRWCVLNGYLVVRTMNENKS